MTGQSCILVMHRAAATFTRGLTRTQNDQNESAYTPTLAESVLHPQCGSSNTRGRYWWAARTATRVLIADLNARLRYVEAQYLVSNCVCNAYTCCGRFPLKGQL